MESKKKNTTISKIENGDTIAIKSKKGKISIKIAKFSSQDIITGWTNSGWSKHGGWNHLKW